jgi:large subunit ribosomal protein L18
MKFIAKKRRYENRTDYRKRKKMLETSKYRLVVRKTNRYIILQYVESINAKDKIIRGMTSAILLKYGWPEKSKGSLKSIPASYLLGLLFGKKIKDIKAIDTGLIRNTRGSRVYATLKGIEESGCKISVNKDVVPDSKKIETENVKTFFNKVKENILKEK